MIDSQVKKQFPLLANQPGLVYLDSAATSQKPASVIDAVSRFYQTSNANVHRGVYRLAAEATGLYENAREKVRNFINARSVREIIFVRNATEAINLVAHSYLPASKNGKLHKGGALVSAMEHHANIVPWQLNSHKVIEVINLAKDYRLDMEDFERKLEQFQPDLVAVTHASNVLGTVNPVKEIIKLAHEAGARVLIDGAQAVPHLMVDVRDLAADFYVFSGHKMLAPTGIGVLYAKEDILNEMPPFLGGGEMISRVGFDKSEWNELPWKFEAGTPHIAGAIGLGAAVEYIQELGFAAIKEHEQSLAQYTLEKLSGIQGLKLYGPSTGEDRLGLFSFSLAGLHAHDVASMLDEANIEVRAGHHCAMPLHTEVIRQAATVRASLYIYNTKEDIDKLIMGLERVREKLT